ncbi:P-protein [Rubripirellula amarantea]|uniref:prephenate dehydratase n=1 Tax=Rubripirellula amarantea TaxID=2527999 RepID=A0A5C5WEN4_9BACT|nr:prephenate dehydratase [Rubripirellula amarantea]TWT49090.1 P-protein [Rubripirellula amarantea]
MTQPSSANGLPDEPRSNGQPATDARDLLAKIDALDTDLLALFDQRHQLVREVSQSGGLVEQVSKSALQIENVVATAPRGPSSLTAAQRIELLKHLSSVCLSSLHELRVAYLGPQHSYSHLATIKYFGDGTAMTPVASIPSVFEAVSRGDVATGVVPIENSTDGRVVDTLGMFVRCDMTICGEVLLPIHHTLLSRTARDQITEVRSKPQALSQCRTWLASNLPDAKLVEVSSTAAAAKAAANTPGVAAVASMEAGRQYGLDVIDARIEDNPDNVTRFAVLGKERPEPTGNDKTAILFQVNHEPGALADAMTIFKDAELNLTWIESFPAIGTINEYLFFIELTGHRNEPAVMAAVDKLRARAQRLTILGSYPKAT